jgi:hypothetical protein
MKTTKEKINKVFNKVEHSGQAIVEVYKLAIPDFDNAKKIDGFPEVNRKFSEFLFEKFIELDKKNKESFPGGSWVNYGFSTNENLKSWEISTKNVTLEY